MPIKGLSEDRRITRGGYIRLGTKKTEKNGKKYPAKSDHFIPDFEDETNNRLFRELYGEKPKKITICFAANNPDEIFPQWYKCYGAGTGLKCKGDGDRAERYEGNQWVPVSCPSPQYCKYAAMNGGGDGKRGCKPLASLRVFVRGIPGLQIIQINTTSKNSIINLNSGIDLLQRVRGNRSIAGVWMDLLLVPQDTKTPDGKRAEIFVMKLDVPCGIDEVMALHSSFAVSAALPAPPVAEEKDPLLYAEAYAEDDDNEAESVPAMVMPAEQPAPDKSDLLRQVTDQRKRLGWTPQQMGAHIQQEFGKDGQALSVWELDRLVKELATMRPARPEPEPEHAYVGGESIDDSDF